ncbi:AraC family transcriptional regulator [Aquimarina sp. AD1]|uniref:helix-turn-helix transcriptional regulator n=1 Tax=Aquimarina sp. (strain AD1) TaxID=1714848 RepID=UPI000E496DAA|nr:AraC family transcriptional regulator [Aquimarina sp. AD1]AXT56866.1 AraC family transcriptional regulator [Aquimarina sp. AD1]RKN29401.1 helix-turn-helix domain-containing protein [Aquimarina sp. AD1]
MKVVPQVFYQHPRIEKVLIDGLSCVILKNVKQADLQNERYLASHALTLVLNGGLQVETPEGDLTIVQKNQIILLPRGLYMISDIIPKDNSFEAIVFFFDEEITDEFLNNFEVFTKEDTSTNLVLEYDQNLRLFTDTLLTLYRGKNQHQFTRPKLLELLHLISISKQGSEFLSKLFQLKKRAKKNIRTFMNNNFDKPLDVEDYSYLTGRSISTFRRDFKSKFGISPKKWLTERRLEKASFLLKDTNDSVTSIARQVGYENTPHFIKTFQKKFNISPKQFQIKYRKDIMI